MKWTVYLEATNLHRLFSRVIQTLESQRVSISMVHAEVISERLVVTIGFESGSACAYRVEALLYKIHGVDSVVIVTPPETSPLGQ